MITDNYQASEEAIDTLRDVFAASAMQAIIQNCGKNLLNISQVNIQPIWTTIATMAYEQADAMLGTREKVNGV